MAVVEPGKGRAVIENDGAGLRITIPAAAQLYVTAFMGFWLIGWAIGEVTATRHLFFEHPDKAPTAFASLFMIAWLGVWTVGGAWAITAFLWNIAGKEIIELNSTMLRRRKQIPIFSRSKEYAVASIANLRLAPPPSYYGYYQQNMSSLTFKDGTISFDYGRDTYHLGSGLDEADAKYVIGEMCRRVKSLGARVDEC